MESLTLGERKPVCISPDPVLNRRITLENIFSCPAADSPPTAAELLDGDGLLLIADVDESWVSLRRLRLEVLTSMESDIIPMSTLSLPAADMIGLCIHYTISMQTVWVEFSPVLFLGCMLE